MSGVPLFPLGCKWGNFGFWLFLRYNVIEELEQIFEMFQFPVIFLTEALELRRILVADIRVELAQSVFCDRFVWGPTLPRLVREYLFTRPSFTYRLHIVY